MKRIIAAYKDLLGIIFKSAPFTVILTFLCAVVSGILVPLGIYTNQNVVDGGLAVAKGDMVFFKLSDFSHFVCGQCDFAANTGWYYIQLR